MTVLPLTSHSVDAPLLPIAMRACSMTGLDHDSWIMIDKLKTVRRSNIRARIGRIDATTMLEVERLTAAFLGFGS